VGDVVDEVPDGHVIHADDEVIPDVEVLEEPHSFKLAPWLRREHLSQGSYPDLSGRVIVADDFWIVTRTNNIRSKGGSQVKDVPLGTAKDNEVITGKNGGFHGTPIRIVFLRIRGYVYAQSRVMGWSF
jgi:hypothetical protein